MQKMPCIGNEKECNETLMEESIISIATEEKDLKVVIQDNLSPEKHISRIFGNTFMMLRNKKKTTTTMICPKLEYAEVIWSPHKKKTC